MQIITKDERYRPNVLKKAIMRHIASPASQDTVLAHPISNGIIRNVTWTMTRCNISHVCYKQIANGMITLSQVICAHGVILTKRSAIDKCITRFCIRDLDFRFFIMVSTEIFPMADITIRML